LENDRALDALRARVWSDPDLAARLAAIPDAQLAGEVEIVARAMGLVIGPDEIARAIDASRGAWLLRWIR
jgi:hypothetical protein